MFYAQDGETGKQESLQTKVRAEAVALLHARNEANRQPQLNLQMAKAYLAGADSGISSRTWRDAFNAIIQHKQNSTKDRWERGSRQKAFERIHDLVIVETTAEQLLACMKAGTVSTNVLLRELHNYCLSMNWLAWPIIPRRLWPKFEYKPKRAITLEEHRRIIALETNRERRSFLEMCWHLGGSQSDIANLSADNIDWSDRVISYTRRKTGSLASIHFGPAVEAVLHTLPSAGLLFPRLAPMQEKHRAKEFRRLCNRLAITVYLYIRTATPGQNAPNNVVTQSASPRKPSATTARPCIGPTRAKHR